MEETYKEVYFGQYCETCRWRDKMEHEDPCHECLNEPVNVHSHKPVKYEKTDRKRRDRTH